MFSLILSFHRHFFFIHQKFRIKKTRNFDFTSEFSFSTEAVVAITLDLLLSYAVQTVVLHVVLGAGFALATQETRTHEEEKRRRHYQKESETGEDADDLRSMPEDRCSAVTQFVFTRTFVVMAEEEVII